MKRKRSVRRWRSSVIAVLAAGFLAAPITTLEAVDFLRGDANSDGQVSIADAQLITAFLFRGGQPPLCLASADTDNDGVVSLQDAIELLFFVAAGGDAPVAPFPTPGADVPSEAPSEHDNFADRCDSYGGGVPLEDAAAKLSVVDGTADGGDDNTVHLRVAVSSSAPIGAYSGILRAPPGLLYADELVLTEVSGTQPSAAQARALTAGGTDGDTVEFGFLSSISEDAPIPAGEDRVVLALTLYLQVGVAAGTYDLTFDSGELVDAESGQAIAAQLGGARLTVRADVTGDRRPDRSTSPIPEDFDFRFELGDAEAARGGAASVPFFVLSNGAVGGYAVSIDVDETALEVTEIERTWQRPDGEEFAFAKFEYDNTDAVPGSSGVSEGFIIGAAVFSFDRPLTIPPNTDTEVLRFHFTVKPDAPLAPADLRFEDGARGSGEPVFNSGTVGGSTFTPDLAGSFVFVNAQVNVLPEVTLFRRGDSNGDALVDLSDAQTTINFLFLGARPPECRDAADANDDGSLDVSDPLATLNHLFFSAPGLPAPYPDPGVDATPDDLDCESGTRSA